MRNHIYTFILGITITLLGLCGYYFFQLNQKVENNTSDIKAIVDFINQQVEASRSNATSTKK